jgi:tryptophan synthase beta chain
VKLAKDMKEDEILLINLSGRGDKDMHTVAKAMGVTL